MGRAALAGFGWPGGGGEVVERERMLLECKYVLLCDHLVSLAAGYWKRHQAKSVPPLERYSRRAALHTFQRYPLTNCDTIVLFTQYSCLAKIVDGPQLSLRQGR